jgi:hypothetical protein
MAVAEPISSIRATTAGASSSGQAGQANSRDFFPIRELGGAIWGVS